MISNHRGTVALLVLLTVLGLIALIAAACGDDGEEATPTAEPTAAQPTAVPTVEAAETPTEAADDDHGEEISFEELFRTPHGLDLRHAAALFGASYERVTSWEHYRAALKAAFSADGLSMIHVPVDRDDSVEHVRALAAAVTDAVRQAAW